MDKAPAAFGLLYQGSALDPLEKAPVGPIGAFLSVLGPWPIPTVARSRESSSRPPRSPVSQTTRSHLVLVDEGPHTLRDHNVALTGRSTSVARIQRNPVSERWQGICCAGGRSGVAAWRCRARGLFPAGWWTVLMAPAWLPGGASVGATRPARRRRNCSPCRAVSAVAAGTVTFAVFAS